MSEQNRTEDYIQAGLNGIRTFGFCLPRSRTEEARAEIRELIEEVKAYFKSRKQKGKDK